MIKFAEKKKLIKGNFTSLVISDVIKVSKKIGGSASYTLDQNDIPVKYISSENKTNLGSPKVKCKVLKPFEGHEINNIVFVTHCDFDQLLKDGFIERCTLEYALNKSKVRAKIMSYANLKKSKTFLAFYSISFPCGLPDQVIRKIHNTVLTRLRRYNSKLSYIWVAERQKNGTLHFHMLTNNYFNIRVINHMYAKAIDTQVKKVPDLNINYDWKKYNGCDVKRVDSLPRLAKYLVKYVSKNNEKMKGLLWNCDASVSALITHVYLTQDEFNKIANKVIYMMTITKDGSLPNSNIEFDVYSYGSYRPKIIFSAINEINEFILSDHLKLKKAKK